LYLDRVDVAEVPEWVVSLDCSAFKSSVLGKFSNDRAGS
jgi:hypothetical protein